MKPNHNGLGQQVASTVRPSAPLPGAPIEMTIRDLTQNIYSQTELLLSTLNGALNNALGETAQPVNAPVPSSIQGTLDYVNAQLVSANILAESILRQVQ